MRLLSFIKHQFKDLYHYYLSKPKWTPAPEIQKICQEMEDKGYSVVPAFLSRQNCQEILSEVDSLFEKYDKDLWSDELGADKRFFGIERKSTIINQSFYQSPLINGVLDYYEHSFSKNSLIMAGRIDFKKENLGSGQGWHRDRADFKQTKAILYLTDTNDTNGPFQYIEKSHKPIQLWRDFLKFKISLTNSRIKNEEVSKLISTEPDRLKTFTAPAGTLLFVDTRGIHRGAPLKSQRRYALTNYSWYQSDIPGHIKRLIIS